MFSHHPECLKPCVQWATRHRTAQTKGTGYPMDIHSPPAHSTHEKRVTTLKAIRLKCLDCCCGSATEVKLCPAQACALWPFRLGKNPNRKGMGNAKNLTRKV